MLVSLAVSLLVALLLMPGCAALALPAGPEREFRFIRRLVDAYGRLLDGALARRRLVGALALLVLAGGAALVPRVGTEFMPLLDEGALAVNVVRLPNASLPGAVEVAGELERRVLAACPEAATVVSKTGRAEISEDPMGPEQTDVFVMLKPRGAWRPGVSRDAVVDAVRRAIEGVPGLRASFSQPIALRVNELISGIKSDVAVKVFGDDLDRIAEVAGRVAAAVGATPGAVDAKAPQLSGMTQFDIEIDRDAAARYGVNIADVNALVETAVGGRVVSTLIEGQRRFGIAVRYPEAERASPEALARLLVSAPGGAGVPLGQIARIRRAEAPIEIGRENGRRRLVVECNVRGRDLGGFVADLKRRLAPIERSLPAGWSLEFGGQFENQERAFARLAILVPVALALIATLLVASLGSVRDALVVVLNLPFALVGGVGALVLAGMTASVSVAVGFIVLLGIAVQNGVILVAFIRELLAAGRPLLEAAREGARLRFRPLLMTALTSWISHLPMLFAFGAGAEIQKPLAVVVMGGLFTSSLLTLLILPVVFVGIERRFSGPGRESPGGAA